MSLIPQWKLAWRWYSMHALVIAAALPFVWDYLPTGYEPPEWAKLTISALAGISGLIGRLVLQEKPVTQEQQSETESNNNPTA